jgi:DNA polymerase-3 subunit beta
MEDEVVNLNVVETNELIITGKSLKFNLQILDPNNFPLIGFREQGNKINLDPKELKKAIAQVIISVDENNKKILLTGMNLKGSKNQKFLEIYTTDSFRISRRLIQLDQELKMNVDINIPFKTLTEILRLADSTTSMMAIIFSGYLTLVFDGYALLQTNLIEGKFPNVERAFPNDFATRIILNRAKIIRSINRANIGNEENVAQSVTLDIKNDIIKLSSQSIDVGNYDEDFRDFKLTGTEQLISFNTKFLLEALKSFDTEEIELNLISPTKPLEIQTLDDESLKQLILPLSIN